VPPAALAAMLGEEHVTLFRGDLETVLRDATRDTVEIRFGTRIEAVTQDATGVHAALTDGTALDADLLIGAGGIGSAVRELVFGPEHRFRVDVGNIIVAAFALSRLPPGLREHAVAIHLAPGRTMVLASTGARHAASFGRT